MTTLHIFNPEHDIALASNMERFTAPHAGRQLRGDLGYLPAFWAEEGDVVIVDASQPCGRKKGMSCWWRMWNMPERNGKDSGKGLFHGVEQSVP